MHLFSLLNPTKTITMKWCDASTLLFHTYQSESGQDRNSGNFLPNILRNYVDLLNNEKLSLLLTMSLKNIFLTLSILRLNISYIYVSNIPKLTCNGILLLQFLLCFQYLLDLHICSINYIRI